MANDNEYRSFGSAPLFAAVSAAFLAFLSGCGLESASSSTLLAEAIDEHSAEVEAGAESTPADLIFALFAAGLEGGAVVNDDLTDPIGDDPRDRTDRHSVDEPLSPSAADDRWGPISGTSPDPAPEINGDGSVSDCEEGFAAFQGECLLDAIVDGLLALGLNPEAPASDDD